MAFGLHFRRQARKPPMFRQSDVTELIGHDRRSLALNVSRADKAGFRQTWLQRPLSAHCALSENHLGSITGLVCDQSESQEASSIADIAGVDGTKNPCATLRVFLSRDLTTLARLWFWYSTLTTCRIQHILTFMHACCGLDRSAVDARLRRESQDN